MLQPTFLAWSLILTHVFVGRVVSIVLPLVARRLLGDVRVDRVSEVDLFDVREDEDGQAFADSNVTSRFVGQMGNWKKAVGKRKRQVKDNRLVVVIVIVVNKS